MSKLKIGLDVHGVIDTHHKLLSTIAQCLIDAGHEVHVITGAHHKDVYEDIKDFPHTHFFGIADYHKEIGTEMTYDEEGRPWTDKVTWIKTKGEYCRREGIDFHLDDSEYYNEFFTTPFALMKTI